MTKPKARVLEYYDFYELMDYVQEKTGINCLKRYEVVDNKPVPVENLKEWIYESLYTLSNDSHHSLAINDWLENTKLSDTIRKGLEFIKEEFCKDSDYLKVYISW